MLDYKKLPYRHGVHPPAAKKSEIAFSTKKLVPIIDDGGTIVEDSTDILRYLEEKYPTPPALPADPDARKAVWALEDWIDSTLGPDFFVANNLGRPANRKRVIGALARTSPLNAVERVVLPLASGFVLRKAIATATGKLPLAPRVLDALEERLGERPVPRRPARGLRGGPRGLWGAQLHRRQQAGRGRRHPRPRQDQRLDESRAPAHERRPPHAAGGRHGLNLRRRESEWTGFAQQTRAPETRRTSARSPAVVIERLAPSAKRHGMVGPDGSPAAMDPKCCRRAEVSYHDTREPCELCSEARAARTAARGGAGCRDTEPGVRAVAEACEGSMQTGSAERVCREQA